MGQEQIDLLHEEVSSLKDLVDFKKEEGETLYTDIRDHLSAQEDALLTSHDQTNNYSANLLCTQTSLNNNLTNDCAQLAIVSGQANID